MIRFTFFIWILTATATAAPNILSQAKQDMQQARYTSAINKLQQLLDKEQSNYEAWFLFGVAHVHEQQSHQAIEAFRHVIALRPDLAEPHNNLAAVYNNLGDTQAAVHELEIALEKRPSYAIAEENLADLYVKLALENYRNSLKHGGNPMIEKRYARLLQVRNPILPQKGDKVSNPPVLNPPASVVAQNIEASSSTQMEPVVDKSITGVLDALEAWRQAWVSQNLTAYFAAYTPGYQASPEFTSQDAWKTSVAKRFTNKNFDIQFEQVGVDIPDNRNTAVVNLRQTLKSDTYNERIKKRLHMKYTSSGWKIFKEVVMP